MHHALLQWSRNAALAATVSAVAAGGWAAANRPPRALAHSASAAPTFVRFTDVPSHNGLYRASLIPARGSILLGQPFTGEVEVRTADGAPVDGATLMLATWLPELDRAGATQPRFAAALGGGRYRVEGLRFERDGWWNVKLTVSAPAGTDSLAFNIIL